jgi:predicted CDP-diglyceride synthetase/phosphatidate cytidylyltransferase
MVRYQPAKPGGNWSMILSQCKLVFNYCILAINYYLLIIALTWLVLFLIMPYIVAVLFNEIACFLGDQLRNFLTCEPYQNFS